MKKRENKEEEKKCKEEQIKRRLKNHETCGDIAAVLMWITLWEIIIDYTWVNDLQPLIKCLR
jgi:hypothetical protein